MRLVIIFMLTLNTVWCQEKRTVNKSEVEAIKSQVRVKMGSLLELYNNLLTSTSDEREQFIKNQTLFTFEARAFLDDDVVIENDFAINDIELPENANKKVKVYLSDLAENYGEKDNGERPNEGKRITFSSLNLSQLQLPTPQDSLNIKAYFTTNYAGKATNGFLFKQAERVAIFQIDRVKNKWKVYIKAINFYKRYSDYDYSRNVVIKEDNIKLSIQDTYSAHEYKIVCMNPILKAFIWGGFYGLLSDGSNDNERKILIQPALLEIGSFSDEGLALICQDTGEWGYINYEGKVVIPCQYVRAKPFLKGKATVQLGMELFSIDVNGKRIK